MNIYTVSSALFSLCLSSEVAAECVDNPKGWVDGASGPGYDCATYAQGQWCTTDGRAGVGWNRDRAFGWGRIRAKSYKGTGGKTFDEACCACGGGSGDGYTAPPEYNYTDYVFTLGDKKKARAKSRKKIAVGREWVDRHGYSCRVYDSMNLCNSDGTAGDGWDEAAWGSIHSYKNAGRSCFGACEVCGWHPDEL